MMTITGKNPVTERKELYRKSDIIFSTPQTIRNDILKDIIDLREFCLIVFDEAHRSVGNYSYSLIAKKFSEIPNYQILALTASPGATKSKIKEISSNLMIDKIQIKDRTDPDVAPYIKNVKDSKISVNMDDELVKIIQFLETAKKEKINELNKYGVLRTHRPTKTLLIRMQERLSKEKTEFSFANMSFIAEILKYDYLIELIETQTVYSAIQYIKEIEKSRITNKAAARILKNQNFLKASEILHNSKKENPKLEKMKEILENEIKLKKDFKVIIFSKYRDTIHKINEELKNLKNIAPVKFVGQAKRKGLGLSQKEQMQILNEFEMGIYNTLIASQIGEEGLSLNETDMVIFYEPVPSAIRKIQRAGRTGRTKEGSVITLIVKDTRDEIYYYIGKKKEEKMNTILRSWTKKNFLKS